MLNYGISEKIWTGFKKCMNWISSHLMRYCLAIFVLLMASGGALAAEPGQAAQIPGPSILTYCYQGSIKANRLVVVDKFRQRVMVFKYMGELIQEFEFPCATGSKPGAKTKEGDERTPVGIYFTTHRYKDNKVTIFGDRAIHLDYPSPFDIKAGRQGNGIYFHGTNQELKPTSTNGCIVLGNGDMATLSKLIKDQRTPVAVVENFKLADLHQRKEACKYLFDMVEKHYPSSKAAVQGFSLAFRQNGVKVSQKMHQLPGWLFSIPLNKMPQKLSIKQNGYLLLGVLDQWVLVTDQQIRTSRRVHHDSSRRHYLLGKNPLSATLLNDHLVLPTMQSARQIASLLPPRPTPKPVPQVKTAQTDRDKLEMMFEAWLKEWNKKQIRRYIRHYARDFSADGLSRRQWYRKKAYLNKVYKVIRVRADEVEFKLDGKRASIRFIQHYRSDWHKDVGVKLLELVLRGDRWQIISETWQALEPMPAASG
jgi:hypothetical protein